MIQAILPFITAIGLSVIAAYYSVIGLAQIFPGSFWPIIVMGAVLEVAKLVTVSWLYNNWKETILVMKVYFITAIILVMLITSMGIFGFLSRAHIESNIVVGANSVQIKQIELRENLIRERLTYLYKQAGDDPEKVARTTDRQIRNAQAQLVELTKEKLPLLRQENILKAEVGPIMFIAEFLYGEGDPQFIDKAVRTVIFIIIFVFDPLAVLLLIAANQSYRKYKNEKPKTIIKKVNKKKKLDLPPSPSLDSFFIDKDKMLVPRNQITKMKDS
tara:strand:+ start:1249 stop:2067 length:819 start_codon:yes stop_codon:yes gene_type:complete